MSPSGPSLPREQEGPRSQQLLTVLLGDYWFGRSDPIPSAALIDLMRVFDVSEAGARAAVQRLSQRGVLYRRKDGRKTSYGVPAMSQEKMDSHVARLFRSHLPQAWDGTWTVVTYSIPEEAKDLRRSIREVLRAGRFGALYDGVWVRPGDVGTRIRGELADRSPEAWQVCTIFTGAQLSPDQMSHMRAAYALDELRGHYSQFIDEWAPLEEQLRGADRVALISELAGEDREAGAEALRLRTSIMTEWRLLSRRDPKLPQEVLGEAFPLQAAVGVVSTVYDALGPLAEETVKRIIASHDEPLAELVSHHTFATFTS